MCVLFRYSRFFFSLLSLPSLHTYARVCVAGPALRERSEEQIKSHRTLPSWWPFLFVSRHSFRKETEILGCSDVAALPSSLSMSAATAAASTGGGGWDVVRANCKAQVPTQEQRESRRRWRVVFDGLGITRSNDTASEGSAATRRSSFRISLPGLQRAKSRKLSRRDARRPSYLKGTFLHDKANLISFGAVYFKSETERVRSKTSAKFALISSKADSEGISTLLSNDWNLRQPSVLISVVGSTTVMGLEVRRSDSMREWRPMRECKSAIAICPLVSRVRSLDSAAAREPAQGRTRQRSFLDECVGHHWRHRYRRDCARRAGVEPVCSGSHDAVHRCRVVAARLSPREVLR